MLRGSGVSRSAGTGPRGHGAGAATAGRRFGTMGVRTPAMHSLATVAAAVVLRVRRPRVDGCWFRVPAGESALQRSLRARIGQDPRR